MTAVYISRYDHELRESRPETEHRLGRLLLLKGIKELCKMETDELWINSHILCGPDGKPEIPGLPIHFNITHCSGLAVCAFDRSPVGVDTENIRPFRDSILRRVLNENENAPFSEFTERYPGRRDEMFFRIWTLKESVIKQSGEGLRHPLTDIDLSDMITLYNRCMSVNDQPETVSHDADCLSMKMIPAPSMPELEFFQSVTYDGYIISLCRRAGDPSIPLIVDAGQYTNSYTV